MKNILKIKQCNLYTFDKKKNTANSEIKKCKLLYSNELWCPGLHRPIYVPNTQIKEKNHNDIFCLTGLAIFLHVHWKWDLKK